MADLVLVTGGSGFIGAHCILRLLAEGYRVRTTVRSRSREPDVRRLLAGGGAEPGTDLEFAVADLRSDEGWAAAVEGCDYVLHVASPFPADLPRDGETLLVPARDGTARVLRAAHSAGVHRVVLTSSFAAVAYGRPRTSEPISEDHWTELHGEPLNAYLRSKTLAEQAAWEFVRSSGEALELAVINPAITLGPVLGRQTSGSIEIVRRLLDGAVPGLPNMYLAVVDVRDVADLHVRAMIDPRAAGERFLAVAGEPLNLPAVARLLRERLGPAARRVPTFTLPDWAVRVAAVVDPAIRQILPDVSHPRLVRSDKARQLLGWSPRSPEEAILATAESLLRLGLVKHTRPARTRSARRTAPDSSAGSVPS